ncbi:MAG: hypothetical protein KGQ79_07135 [Proteobacteria bacterium]|nr:hypothetical protein [Pseudomonadota bacterium]MBU6424854.1 hypothetical protein [Rhodospirillales bacterium]
MARLFIFLLLLCAAGAARADAAGQCAAQGGSYLTGTIAHGPFYVRAREIRHGVALSHTKILLNGDDGQRYDIRADNVFAAGYDAAPNTVPAPLSSLQPGDRISLRGKLYQSRSGRMGMDWVHTNCGDVPRHNAPNGWLKEIGPDMLPGRNLEGSDEYCNLW